MHQKDRHSHVNRNSEGGYTAQQPDDQADAAQELSQNGENRKDGWNPHVVCEGRQCAGKSAASEPAEYLLSAMRQKYDSQYGSDQRERVVVSSTNYSSKQHSPLPMRLFVSYYRGAPEPRMPPPGAEPDPPKRILRDQFGRLHGLIEYPASGRRQRGIAHACISRVWLARHQA